MTKVVVLGVGALSAAAASLILVGAGVAVADSSGQTYAQVQAALKDQGYTVIQATSVGDKFPQSECLVVRQLTKANGHVMLSLDCNSTSSSSGSH